MSQCMEESECQIIQVSSMMCAKKVHIGINHNVPNLCARLLMLNVLMVGGLSIH